MVEKIKVWVELSGGDIAKVPEWVKTEEDLENLQMNTPIKILV